MTRVLNQEHKVDQVTLYPGEIYVTNSNEIITTILGSCVSLCLFDKINGISGMNHYMLPQKNGSDLKCTITETSLSLLRYGEIANKELLNQMVELGADLTFMEAKVFGGGSVISSLKYRPSIGQRNISCAEDFLLNNNIEIISKNIGSDHGRKISLFTETHNVLVRVLTDETSQTVHC
jgi:chemotaxis protein CheD